MSKTRSLSKKEAQTSRQWWVVDAEGCILGRLASQVAFRLQGKHKPSYTSHVDTGDFMIIINAEKIRLTGQKEHNKMYIRHTGHVGGIVERSAAQLRLERPTHLLRDAIARMMPKTQLGRQMFDKLTLYAGAQHDQSAQQPQPLTLQHVR